MTDQNSFDYSKLPDTLKGHRPILDPLMQRKGENNVYINFKVEIYNKPAFYSWPYTKIHYFNSEKGLEDRKHTVLARMYHEYEADEMGVVMPLGRIIGLLAPRDKDLIAPGSGNGYLVPSIDHDTGLQDEAYALISESLTGNRMGSNVLPVLATIRLREQAGVPLCLGRPNRAYVVWVCPRCHADAFNVSDPPTTKCPLAIGNCEYKMKWRPTYNAQRGIG